MWREGSMKTRGRASRRRVNPVVFMMWMVALLVLGPPPLATATTLPGFEEEIVFSGLTQPTALQFSPDGRVFVAEKSGIIKVFDDLADTTPTVFADLRTQVYNFWDRGLLDIAVAPGFPANPWVYVLYTHDAPIGGIAPTWGTVGATSDGCPSPPGATSDGCVASGHLSRLEASGDTAIGLEQVLIEGWCQQYPSHSMGSLAFGADGALYVSAGDGASFNFTDFGQEGSPVNPCGDPPGGMGGPMTPPTAEGGALRSQDLRTMGDPTGLNGTILRVSPVTGAGLPDNPLASSSDPNARRIVAYGLRNPFRITIRPGTHEVWIGEVGWNRWEEIDRLVSPTAAPVDNFGWPCYEGLDREFGYNSADLTLCETLYAEGTAAIVTPYFRYRRSELVIPGDGCPIGGSSLAGVVFGKSSGGTYPAEYAGALFFADYTRGCIWAAPAGAAGLPDMSKRRVFVSGAAQPVDIEIGPNGDLFYVDFGGTVRRIRYFNQNQPPHAVINANPTAGAAPLTVTFDGTASSDPNGDPLTYAWDLDGDGAFDDAAMATTTYTYTQPGTYTATLQVADSSGLSATASITVAAGNTPPSAVIDAPMTGTRWHVGEVISFAGHATDAQSGLLPASALTWSLVLMHCPSTCHEHPIQTYPGVAGGSFAAPDHEYPSHLELRLTATDPGGLSTTTKRRLDPQTVDLTFASSPTGLTLAVGPNSRSTPFTHTAIAGSVLSISAPSPQTSGSSRYGFVRWSDGGAQTHNVTANVGGQYVATYAGPPAVIARTPSSGATGVSVTTTVTARFNRAMTAATINSTTFQLRDAANALVPATVSYNASTFIATLRPSNPLAVATRYTATVRGGSTDPRVKDASGNWMSSNITWSFTTAASATGDTTPPAVIARTPSTGATGVSLISTVTARFSEAMNPATVNGSTFQLRNAANVLIPATVSYNASTFRATLTPTSPLAASTRFTATIRGGTTEPRVKDAAGNAMKTNISWSFTTVATE